MNFDQYQDSAASTAVYPNIGYNLPYVTLGLVGEAGEFANKVKKILRGDARLEEKRQELRDELGDILWYVAMIANELSVSLDGTAMQNLEKLQSRKTQQKIKGDGDNR